MAKFHAQVEYMTKEQFIADSLLWWREIEDFSDTNARDTSYLSEATDSSKAGKIVKARMAALFPGWMPRSEEELTQRTLHLFQTNPRLQSGRQIIQCDSQNQFTELLHELVANNEDLVEQNDYDMDYHHKPSTEKISLWSLIKIVR